REQIELAGQCWPARQAVVRDLVGVRQIVAQLVVGQRAQQVADADGDVDRRVTARGLGGLGGLGGLARLRLRRRRSLIGPTLGGLSRLPPRLLRFGGGRLFGSRGGRRRLGL